MMSVVSIHEFVHYIFIPVRDIVEKKGPIIVKEGKIHDLFDFFVDLKQYSIGRADQVMGFIFR